MSKKIFILVTIAALAAVAAGAWVSTTAYAKVDGFGDRLRIARRGLGQVVSLGENQFSVQRQDGEMFTVLVNEHTNFRAKDREELGFDDLQIDGWVIVVPARTQSDDFLARVVFILADDFDPSQYGGARGLITSVDVAANLFSLETNEGEQLQFYVNKETRFWGDYESLVDLETDMEAHVRSQTQEDGSLLALGVMSASFDRKEVVKKLGIVLEVDPQDGAFTIQTRGDDEPVTIEVDENTRFRSPDQAVQKLEDLQPEMIVALGAREQEEGLLLAVVVTAVNREQLPNFELRTAGRVIAVETNSFTIKARSGVSYSILVTGDTQFRGSQVQSMDDLEVGMIVTVGGKELGNGQHDYQAMLVLIAPPTR